MYTKEEYLLIAIVTASILILFVISYFYYTILKYNKIQLKEKEEQFKKEIALLEKDRTRIASDLHDSVNGLLAATKLELGQLINLDMQSAQLVTNVQNNITTAVKHIKDTSYNLMPSLLVNHGLEQAIVALSKKQTVLQVEFKYYVQVNWHEDVAVHIYRIIEEILQNAIKHANATKLQLLLVRNDNFYRLIAKDNGVGCIIENISIRQNGIGFVSLRSRTQAIGGSLKMHSEPNKGLEIVIDIPHQNATQYNA